MRNITLSHNRLKKGVWLKDGGRQLTGATVAIIGCGNVGKELCRLLQSFSCKIYLVDIEDRSSLEKSSLVQQSDLSFALENADIVSVHVPLTTLTHQMFNLDNFKKMRKNAFL